MKSLFRKIGKGLSNIGKAIGKVFNSKVGRVIGTLSLAAGMFGLFQVLAGGGVGTAASAGSTLAGTSAGTTASAATSGVTTVGTGATATTTVGSASVGTSAATTATQLGGRVAEAGQTLGGASVVSPITTEAVTEAVTQGVTESTNILKNYADVANAATQSKNLLTEAASTGNINDFFPSIQHATKSSLQLMKETTTKDLPGADVLGKQFLEKNPLVSPAEIDMHVKINQSNLTDQLKNKDFRMQYDAHVEKFGGKPSEAVAKQEFVSYADALEKGEGFFGKSQNVLQHTFQSDLGSVTDGKFTGFGSDAKVTTVASTGASLLAPEPEMPEAPSRPNLYASSIASSQLDTAESLASAPTMSQTVQLNNSISNGANPMQTLNSIRSNAGYSQVYGPYFSMSA